MKFYSVAYTLQYLVY